MKKSYLTLFLLCGAMLPAVFAQEVAPADAAGPKPKKIASFVGATVIIPVESPDVVTIDRRDIVNYMEDAPEEELRVLLTALASGKAVVTTVKSDVKQVFEVEVADPAETDQAATIKDLVGDPNLEVRFVGGSIVLEGEVADDLVARKALQVASAFSTNVLNFLSIKDPLQIKVKIQVVTVDLGKVSAIGLQYRGAGSDLDGNSITGFGLPLSVDSAKKFPFYNVIGMPFTGLPAMGGGSGDFAAMLNARLNNSVAKLLQAPTLMALNGQPAIFRVGQEVPIVTTTVDEGVILNSAEYRPVGVSLIITPIIQEPIQQGIVPGGDSDLSASISTIANSTQTLPNAPLLQTASANTVDENGVIRLFVRPEVSSVDRSNQTADSGFPSFNSKYMETRVALKHQESLVIGGLIDETTRKELEEVPFISKIPILGELFKNRTLNGTKEELIFILTPEVVGGEFADRTEPWEAVNGEMKDYMQEKKIAYKVNNPTRISAATVTPRTADFIQRPAPEMMESAPAENSSGNTMGAESTGKPEIELAPRADTPE